MNQRFLAFDVGGTSIKYAVIDQNYQLTHTGKMPTNHNHNQTVIKTLKKVSHDIQDQELISGIGVSTAGRVGKNGEIIFAGPTITDYQGTPIKATLADMTGLPVHIMNDVDAALMGEVVDGVAKNCQNVYCIALGTGIGGAFYLNGHLYDGAHGMGNSVGYMGFDRHTNSYFEKRSSTLALDAFLKQENISVPIAFAKARNGNQKYEQIINEWCQKIGHGVAQICLLLDPELFIIGGAVSQQGDFFINKIKSAVEKEIPKGLFNTVITAPHLQDKAQLFGAISPFLL